MIGNLQSNFLKVIISVGFITITVESFSFADVYINVLAVNGADSAKDTNIKFNLPGDLSSQDIVDTNGLDLDYNVNDANYFVHGKVTLQPKESKTFRIRVRDVWKLSPEQIEEIKSEIESGYEQIGKQKDPEQAKLLKDQLIQKLDFISQEQASRADSVEKRMDSYRSYSKELERIEKNALNVDYWRSDPSEVKSDKIIRVSYEAENPFDKIKPFKLKQYLPSEVKPIDLVEFEGLEIRFDQDKKQAFVYAEGELQPKDKKKFIVGIRDIWFIPQKEIDYLRKRSDYAYDFLKDSKYGSSAKILYDHTVKSLKEIEDAQEQKRDNILVHISVYRDNQKTFENAKIDVETLEKLLSVFRENLEKSKVQNVLQKVRSLKGIADVSKAIFDKTPNEATSWKFIFWVLVFVGLITSINFVLWFIRSKDKMPPSQDSVQDKKSDEEKKTNNG